MGKIDLDRLILCLRKSCEGVSGRNVAMLRDGIDKLLFDQALEYKDGEIVSIFEPTNFGNSHSTEEYVKEECDNANEHSCFKVGDYVVYEGKTYFVYDKYYDFENDECLYYVIIDNNGNEICVDIEELDKNGERWTIKSANNGDYVYIKGTGGDEWIVVIKNVADKVNCHFIYEIEDDRVYDGESWGSVSEIEIARPASTNDIKLLDSKMEETCQSQVFGPKNKTNYEDITVLAELKKQFEEEDTTEEPTENEFDKIVGYMVRDLAENADCGWLGGEYRSTQYFVDRYKEKLRNAILNENKEK